MVGIVSNGAALFAQRNLATAADTSQSSIARLSSGNAIVKASDDVAGLAIGTVLKTTVATLKTILNSTAQASSLLGIADAGLQNIGDILQRQKSLAVQANTGSLSDNERAFLDQEFQSLVSEINRIVDNTKFNGISLLNGSISGSAGITTATGASTETYSLNALTDFAGSGQLTSTSILSSASAAASANTRSARVAGSGLAVTNSVLTAAAKGAGTTVVTGGTLSAGVAGTNTLTFTGIGVNAQSVVINGATFTFATNGDGSSITNIGLGSSATEAATNLVNAINSVAGQAAITAGTINTPGPIVSAANALGVITLTSQRGNAFGSTITAANLNLVGTTETCTNASFTAATLTGAKDSDKLTVDGTVFTFVANGTSSYRNTIEMGTDNPTTLANIVAHLNDTSVDGGQGSGGTSRVATVGLFTYAVNAAGTGITMTDKVTGVATVGDTILFTQGTTGGTITQTTGTIAGGAAEALNTDATTTYDPTLQGGFSNLTAVYKAGSVGVADTFTANRVQFTTTVGGKTYVSDDFNLGGGVVAQGAATGTGANGLGNAFTNGGVIRFYQAGQGVGSAGNAGFELTIGTTTATVADQTAASTLASNIQSQVTAANVTVNQTRAIHSVDIASTIGTSLEGIAAADVTLTTDGFTTTGTFGDIGSFTVDTTANTISTTVNGSVYTADLAGYDTDAVDGGTYSSSTKLLTLDGVLHFTSASTTDGSKLNINLVPAITPTVDLSTAAGATAFEAALDGLFDVGTTNSLTFQVGTTASDAIGLSLDSAATTSIYQDDDGTVVTLSVDTSENAQAASSVLDNAINTVTSLRATVGALQSRFNFAAANVNSSIQNTDAARGIFLDVDIANESTNFATAQVRLQASISVLAQANQLPQNLLKLIG